MSNRRQYDIAAVRVAIQENGGSPAAIARALGCTRATVYSYLSRYPELKSAFEATRGGVAVEERAQFSEEAFEKAIKDSHGVKAAVAAAVGCSRQTVDNALMRWPHLAEKLDAQRSKLVSSAVSALAAEVENKASDGHQRAYMFVLRTLGKDEGFSERQEITGADGEALISPDLARMITAMGMDTSTVVREFENMVRAAAMAKGVVLAP